MTRNYEAARDLLRIARRMDGVTLQRILLSWEEDEECCALFDLLVGDLRAMRPAVAPPTKNPPIRVKEPVVPIQAQLPVVRTPVRTTGSRLTLELFRRITVDLWGAQGLTFKGISRILNAEGTPYNDQKVLRVVRGEQQNKGLELLHTLVDGVPTDPIRVEALRARTAAGHPDDNVARRLRARLHL